MLQAAAKGYEYQDLLTAIRAVDVLLETVKTTVVDRKLFDKDRFDDLTTIHVDGRRERTQAKHRDAVEPIPLNLFTTDTREMKLDELVASAIADRESSGADYPSTTFRIISNFGVPDDERLLRVLRPAGNDLPPFTAASYGTRLQFDSAALWQIQPAIVGSRRRNSDPFAFIRNGSATRQDVDWFCHHFVLELDYPFASLDLARPGPAEVILLTRLRDEIGVGVYPNADRRPEDVAALLIAGVESARAGAAEITVGELLRRTGLRHDFGAVSRKYPIDPSVEVSRRGAVDDVVRHVQRAAAEGRSLIVTGPPGQGKSWACQRVIDRLVEGGWLVAEHYCFLNEPDTERRPRVMANTIFGSLLRQLTNADPTLLRDLRPRFAADDQALSRAVLKGRELHPYRSIALVVDGLDHVTRVLGATTGQPDPSASVAAELAELELPPGAVLIVMSQPGEHLATLQDQAEVIELAPFNEGELERVMNLE